MMVCSTKMVFSPAISVLSIPVSLDWTGPVIADLARRCK